MYSRQKTFVTNFAPDSDPLFWPLWPIFWPIFGLFRRVSDELARPQFHSHRKGSGSKSKNPVSPPWRKSVSFSYWLFGHPCYTAPVLTPWQSLLNQPKMGRGKVEVYTIGHEIWSIAKLGVLSSDMAHAFLKPGTRFNKNQQIHCEGW